MHRRAFLGAAAAASVATVAGCNGLPGIGNGDGAGPADVVETCYRAAARGDRGAANERVHPDAPGGGLDRPTVDRFAMGEVRVEETGVTAREDGVAEVRCELRFEPFYADERDTREVRPTLRRADGEWLLWDGFRPSPALPTAPRVAWHADEEGTDAVVEALWLTHGGGDDVEASRLAIRAGGRTAATDGGGTLGAGSALVIPLDADGEALSAGDHVDLVWSPPEGDGEAVIARHALADAAAGGLGDVVEVR